MTETDDLLCPDCNPKKLGTPKKREPWRDLCDEIEDAYDELAEKNPVWYPSEQFVRLFTLTLQEMQKTGSPRILDIGCGGGVWEWMLCRYGPDDFEVQAFDISPASIHLAKKKCDDPRVKFWVGNLYCHRCVREVIKGEFDQVWMFEVLQHVPEEYWMSVLSSYFGWLKPGGVFVLIDKDAMHPASQQNLVHYKKAGVPKFFGAVVNYIDIEKVAEMFTKISGHEDVYINAIDDWFGLKVYK